MLSQLFSLRNLARSCYECVPHKQVASILCEPILVSDSLLFSRAFALGRRTESEIRADRNDGGADRAGAARTFEDAVVACDRLTRTVVGGSVKRGAASARGSIPGIATAQGSRNAQAHGGAEHVLGPGRPTLRLLRQRV